jgi:hypothetical protein
MLRLFLSSSLRCPDLHSACLNETGRALPYFDGTPVDLIRQPFNIVMFPRWQFFDLQGSSKSAPHKISTSSPRDLLIYVAQWVQR